MKRDTSAGVHSFDNERTLKKISIRCETMKKPRRPFTKKKPEQAGQDVLFLIEKITPPGTSGAVRRSVNMHRNGA